MGRMKKKGTSGEVSNYVSRAGAIRKLQLSLKDFRRLCILKGVYPREPKNKKRVGKGSTQNKTYYFVKDIAFLAHEPLLKKFREMKVYVRRLKRAKAKEMPGVIKRVEGHAPVFTYDHIVKERYPTFVDAIRDLDDALCLLFLFRQMPHTDQVQGDMVAMCKRLCDELQQYVIRSHSLRKVFLSIKGIYYQAEVMGQTLTWITPYQFSTGVPEDVDFRVMGTFVDFYTTLLGFVNWRLYNDINIVYPPKTDADLDSKDAGLSALILESTATPQGSTAIEGTSEAVSAVVSEKRVKDMKKRSSKRVAAATAAATKDLDSEESPDAEAATDRPDKGSGLDLFPAQMEGGEETVKNLSGGLEDAQAQERRANLFKGLYFFFSRETPRHALEFVVLAFGGQASWQGVGNVGGGPFPAEDPRITHHIVDRPKVSKTFDGRHYLQPQWIVDCVNAGKLLPTADYTAGAVLPPHLSPFVVEGEDDYVAPERRAQLDSLDKAAEEAAARGDDARMAELAGEGEGAALSEDEEEEPEDEEAIFRQELEAERSGKTSLMQSFAKGSTQLRPSRKRQADAEKATATEEKELAKLMMTNKDRKLYGKIMHGKRRKQVEAENLREKRKAVDKSAPKGGSSSSKKVRRK